MHSAREIAFARERRRVLDELGPYFSALLEASHLPERQFEGRIETADGAPPSTKSVLGQTLVLSARLAGRDGAAHDISLRLSHDSHWNLLICVRAGGGEQHLIARGDSSSALATAKDLLRGAFAKLSAEP